MYPLLQNKTIQPRGFNLLTSNLLTPNLLMFNLLMPKLFITRVLIAAISAAGLNLVALQATAAPTPSSAVQTSTQSNEPLLLEADKVTYNDKTGVTTYIGRVIAKRGEMRIEASELIATLNDKREVVSARAIGKPAKFQQRPQPDKGLIQGQGNIIIFDNLKGTVTLSGKAFLMQDGARFSGDRLTYNMTQQSIDAVGSKSRRVQILIPPNVTTTKK